MSLDPYKHDWDTPPNGDFVRYLEQLMARPPAPPPAHSTERKPAAVAKKSTKPVMPVQPASASAGVLSVLQQLRQLWVEAAEQQRQQHRKN